MPRPINRKPITMQEHDAIVARLRQTGCDVPVVMAEFNRGRTTVARLLGRVR